MDSEALKPRPIHMGNSHTKSNTLTRRHDFVLRVARTGTFLAQFTPVEAGINKMKVEKDWALDAVSPKN
jgi:hypothetical protein